MSQRIRLNLNHTIST